MGHGVKNDIDAHRIGFLLGEFAEAPFVLAFPFPAITKIGIVADDTNTTAAIVENGFVVDFSEPGRPKCRSHACVWRAMLALAVSLSDRRPCGK